MRNGSLGGMSSICSASPLPLSLGSVWCVRRKLALTRSLPLNKPAPRRTSPHVARAQSSPAPVVTYTARIRIDRADGTGTLGYVGAVTGAQALLQTSAANAVVVSFSLPVGSTSGSQINLAVTVRDVLDPGTYIRSS